MRNAVVSTILFLFAGSASVQTREAGPWWPNPTWGRGDQAGASNWITPDKVLEAVRLVKTGKIYEIGHYKGLQNLPARHEVTLADVRGALARQGLSESDLRQGDALLLRYGWARFWTEPAKYNAEPPGIGLEVARWVVERKASMVGIMKNGIPVRFKGATGSPGRPLAIR